MKTKGKSLWTKITLALACVCTLALGALLTRAETATPTPVVAASEHDHATMTAWTETDSLPTASGNYYLTENVRVGSSSWSVTSETTITLCLNGKTVDLGGNKYIGVNGNFTVCDCGTGGKITAYHTNCIAVYGGKLTVEGGTIENTYTSGQAISVDTNSAEAVISGGTVKGYSGVMVTGAAKSLTVSGGEIIGEGKDGIINYSAVTMTGGSVSGVRYGVDNDYSATKKSAGNLSVTGGSISGETGIYSWGYDDYDCVVSIGGNATVTGTGGIGLDNNGNSKASVSGTSTVTGTTQGIYNGDKLYLSGTPTITGTTVDIEVGYNAATYAHAEGDTESAYAGENVTVTFDYLSRQDVVIYDVTEANKDSFTLVKPCHTMGLGTGNNNADDLIVTSTSNHTYSSDCDTVCNDCNKTRTAPESHAFDGDCETADECPNCGQVATVAEHVFDNDCTTADKCANCDVTATAGTHVFDNDCTTADKCENCDVTATAGTHVFDNDCTTADKCANCEVTATAGKHVFDNDCTTADKCANCEVTATAGTHVFDNDCTTADKCANCDVTATSGTHVFDNDCTTADKCANCDVTATAIEHEFDNDCTTADKCANCEVNATATEHVFEEGVCENCGFTLEPTPTFTVTVQNGGIDGVDGDTTEVEMGSDDTVTVRANADPEGKVFKGWEIDGVLVSTDRAYTFAPTANTVVKAVYEDVATTPETPETPAEEPDGLSSGAIAGIVIGAVALLGAIGFVVYWFALKKKKDE